MAAASKSTARLREHYTTNVIPALTKEFNYKNVMGSNTRTEPKAPT